MTPPPPDASTRALAELQARVVALEGWIAHHSDLLDDLVNRRPAPDPSPVEPEPEDLDADALIDWVHDTVAAVIARPLRGEHFWCPRWWDHPEAVFRFTALHRAWTELAAEPGAALSLWIRDHLDPCLRELLSPCGPFVDCAHTDRQRAPVDHRPLPTLPTRSP